MTNDGRSSLRMLATGVVVVLLLGLGLTFCAGESGPHPGSAREAVDEADPSADDATERARVGRRAPAPAGDAEMEADDEDEAPSPIEGEVQQASGAEDPIPGARVALLRVARADESTLAAVKLEAESGRLAPAHDEVAVTTTDAEGAYALPHPGPGVFVVRVSADGYADHAEWLDSEWMDFELNERRTFALAVVDAAGRPIAGARVAHYPAWLEDPPVTVSLADAAGRVTLAASDEADVIVSASGYATRLVEDLGERAGAPIVLLDARPIAGVVETSDGEPVADAVVTCTGEGHAVLRTGPDGRFAWDDFPADDAWISVEANAPGYLEADATATPGQSDVRLVLLRPGSITGAALDEDGNPLRSARVWVRGPRASAQTRSSRDGTFRLDGLAPQTLTVRATVSKRVGEFPWPVITRRAETHVEISEGGVSEVELRPIAVSTAFVNLRFIDESGAPIQNAHIHPRVRLNGGSASVTRADGIFRAGVGAEPGEDVDIGVYGLTGYVNGIYPVATAAEPGGTAVDVVIPFAPKGKMIEVQLRMTGAVPTDVAERERAWFGVNAPAYAVRQTFRADPGTLSMTIDVPAGKPYAIRAQVPGAGDLLVTGTAPLAGPLALDFEMAREARVVGRSVLPSGAPYAAVGVEIHIDRDDGRAHSKTTWMTEIGRDGRFVIGGLPTGRGTLRMIVVDGDVCAEQEVAFEAGEDTEVGDVVVGSLPLVSGVVRDALGQPVGGARVVARDGDAHRIVDTSTRPDGSFELRTPIRPGATVEIELLPRRAMAVEALTHELTSGPRTFVVRPPGKFRVVRPGKGHSRPMVQARRASDQRLVRRSNGYVNTPDGNSVAELVLAAGAYDIVFREGTPGEQTLRVTVASGETIVHQIAAD